MFNDRLKEVSEDGILEVAAVVRLLHAELVNFSETLSFVTRSEKADSRPLCEVLRTLSIDNRDGLFARSLLLAPPAPAQLCHFLTEKYVKKSQRSRGLAQVRLNSVLLRDELKYYKSETEKKPRGKICMDMCMIDLTGKMGVDVGSEVEVFGKQNSINDLAALAGTIPYELTCAVSKRVPRIYIRNGKVVEKELLLRG